MLCCVARTALRTKLYEGLADQLTDIVVDAVCTLRKADEMLDLHMVGGCWRVPFSPLLVPRGPFARAQRFLSSPPSPALTAAPPCCCHAHIAG